MIRFPKVHFVKNCFRRLQYKMAQQFLDYDHPQTSIPDYFLKDEMLLFWQELSNTRTQR